MSRHGRARIPFGKKYRGCEVRQCPTGYLTNLASWMADTPEVRAKFWWLYESVVAELKHRGMNVEALDRPNPITFIGSTEIGSCWLKIDTGRLFGCERYSFEKSGGWYIFGPGIMPATKVGARVDDLLNLLWLSRPATLSCSSAIFVLSPRDDLEEARVILRLLAQGQNKNSISLRSHKEPKDNRERPISLE